MLHSSQLARLFEVSNNCWEAAGENNDKTGSRASCAKSDDRAAFESVVTALPLVTYQAGETVIADGSRIGRLLILRNGSVAIQKEDVQIAKVTEPGAVFGELSFLLDQPNKADGRALETSQFHVADAAVLLTQNLPAVLYVARDLARRLNGAIDVEINRILRWTS
jgi:CRP/FNR family transcriptional regulator, cyclic AMP receptor protein